MYSNIIEYIIEYRRCKIKNLNNLLGKIKFAITIQEDIADVLMRDELEDETDNHLFLKEEIIQHEYDLKITTHNKKLYLEIDDDCYELYFIDRLQRKEYFDLLEKFSIPKKCKVLNIEEYIHQGLFNHYEGISFYIEVTGDVLPKDVEPINNQNKKTVLVNIEIIEERKNYLYFKYDNVFFEAKEIVGKFDVYVNYKFVFSAIDKEDLFKQVQKNDLIF